VDWIVMKCLEKDRTRRFETASALAADIQHYLDGDPVRARPPTAGYRVQKFVGRHRIAVSTAAIVSIALLGGSSLATFGMLRARDEAVRATNSANEAHRQATRATKLGNFYKESIVGALDPWNQTHSGLPAGQNITVADLLHHQEELAGGQFKEEPDLECDIRL